MDDGLGPDEGGTAEVVALDEGVDVLFGCWTEEKLAPAREAA